MSTRWQCKRDLAADWTSNNPVLLSGEWGMETDTKKTKIGDGTTAWSSLAYGSSPQNSVAITGGSITGITDLAVADGGTGASTLTDHGLLLGSGAAAVTPLAAATNGQIPIGSTGADPVLATLAGTADQIVVTNGAGTITIAAGGVTQTPTAGKVSDVTALAGGVATAQTQTTYLPNGTYSLGGGRTITLAFGRVTALSSSSSSSLSSSSSSLSSSSSSSSSLSSSNSSSSSLSSSSLSSSSSSGGA